MNEADFDTLKRDWQEKREVAKEASRSASEAYHAFVKAGGTKKGKKSERVSPVGIGKCQERTYAEGDPLCGLIAYLNIEGHLVCYRHRWSVITSIAYQRARQEIKNRYPKEVFYKIKQPEYRKLLRPIVDEFKAQLSEIHPRKRVAQKTSRDIAELQALEEENREHVRRLCATAPSV